MYLNHQRLSVYRWNASPPDARPESLCPECSSPLVAKRGDRVIWHWAHHQSRAGRPCNYGAGETPWHLRWKVVFAELNWLVEARYRVDNPPYQGIEYRFDACRAELTPTGSKVTDVWEFVHSLSDDYIPKSKAIVGDGIDLVWVFDGSAFVSSRHKSVRGREYQGFKNFLKPRAYDAIRQLRGTAYVHQFDYLYVHWRDNVWYPSPHRKTCELFKNCTPDGIVKKHAG